MTASLLFCVGAMAILGSFNAGLKQDYELLFTKSLLDGISSCMLSVSLGLGVLFSSVPLFIYQGLLALLAHVIAPLLSDAAIAEITCCGSVMILAIGLNMLHLTKIKTADLLPAVLFAPLLNALTGARNQDLSQYREYPVASAEDNSHHTAFGKSIRCQSP